MSQEPINIAGVCAFPNPNGVRDMRFVDCNYAHDYQRWP